jgi:hypothetical protein
MFIYVDFNSGFRAGAIKSIPKIALLQKKLFYLEKSQNSEEKILLVLL